MWYPSACYVVHSYRRVSNWSSVVIGIDTGTNEKLLDVATPCLDVFLLVQSSPFAWVSMKNLPRDLFRWISSISWFDSVYLRRLAITESVTWAVGVRETTEFVYKFDYAYCFSCWLFIWHCIMLPFLLFCVKNKLSRTTGASCWINGQPRLFSTIVEGYARETDGAPLTVYHLHPFYSNFLQPLLLFSPR